MGSAWYETKLTSLPLKETQSSTFKSTIFWTDLNFAMELLIVTFVFATTILLVPAGACGLRSAVPEEIREKRSAPGDPTLDFNTAYTLGERGGLAPVLAEENENLVEKRAAAAPVLVEGSFAADHFVGKREAPSHSPKITVTHLR